MIKTVGAGMAVLSLGSLALAEAGAPAAESGKSASAPEKPAKGSVAPQPFTLPPLAYAYDALEPHIDARTMEIHYTKHHQAYIDNANRALAEYPDLLKLTAEELIKDLRVAPEKIRGLLRNNVGGHLNHTLFWSILTPKPAALPGKDLSTAIDAAFGSFDAFKERLVSTAATRFGSGWAWLSLGRDGKLQLHSTANQDSPLLEGLQPVLGIDVWEHAYYLKYQNLRVDYVKAVLRLLDWRAIDRRYALALAALPKG
jgi:Fe-Mn family superoxide dismutase